MLFFKQKSNIVFSAIIFLLVLVIAFLSYTVYSQKNRYISANASLTDNETLLADAERRIAEYSAQIEKHSSELEENKTALGELNQKLKQALEEKEKLQKEILELKQKTELEASEALKSEIRLNNISQANSADSGVCYLTFDDGPSHNTLKVLDVLDSYGIKATFFVVGTGNSNYLSEIHSRGHAIGLHTASHNYSTIYSSVDDYLTDIKEISDIVYSKTGVRSNIMRFPGGSSNGVSASYCKGIMTELTTLMPSLGYSYYDWNVSSGDAAPTIVPSENIVNNIFSGARGKKSICVLMHDSSGKNTTVEALPAVIEGLHEMGFRFAPLTAEVYGFHQQVTN